jgi:protein dithiol:quinone oxidoreductase
MLHRSSAGSLPSQYGLFAMRLNPFQWSFRVQCLAVFAACAGMIGFALFSQTYWDLLPCPLCIFQRIAFAALGVVCLIAALHAPKGALGRRVYGALALIAGGTGIGIAGRHVWLTMLPPDKVPACGPPLQFMVDNPFGDMVKMVLTGSGECAKVDWTFLGLSMPAWSLIWLVALTLFVLYAAFKRPAIPSP